jgi:aspartate kinase
MKVVKFGGTSLASGSQFKKVADIVTSDNDRKIVIVSAPGKRHISDSKVTDLLINCANAYFDFKVADKEIACVLERYSDIVSELEMDTNILETIENDLHSRLTAKWTSRESFIDLMKASGEDNSAKLVAAYFNHLGYKSTYVNPKDAGLLLSSDYGNADVLPESYDNLSNLKHIDGIIIFPGFFGYSKDGEVVTFPRGGSDITGSIIAASVNADLYENFTDVDFVYSANPNVIKNPLPIKSLTYREMRELAYGGFSVLHQETLEPVYRKGIPVSIKNTNNPSTEGTKVSIKRTLDNGPVVGIACDSGFCSLFVSKFLLNKEIGFSRGILKILESESISYEHIPSGIDNISVIIRSDTLTREKEERILQKIKDTTNAEEAFFEKELSLIMVVGEGMMHNIGIAARATTALSRSNVNIEMINQGSSEVSMMFGINEVDSDVAIESLYNEFFIN